MPRQSLLEYFEPSSRPREEAAVVWRRGYCTIRWSYTDLLRAGHRFASTLQNRGVAKGGRVLIWGENSGAWIAAFLGCLLRGAVAVPMDFQPVPSAEYDGKLLSVDVAKLIGQLVCSRPADADEHVQDIH